MSPTIKDIKEFVDFLMCHPKQTLVLIFSIGFLIYFIISSYFYGMEIIFGEDYFDKKRKKKETEIIDEDL